MPSARTLVTTGLLLLALSAPGVVAAQDAASPSAPPAASSAPPPAAARPARPPPQQGAPAFDLFRGFCLDYRLRPEATLAAASAQGWMIPPQSMIPASLSGMHTFGARWRSTRHEMDFLVTGRFSAPVAKQSLTMAFCGVARDGRDPAYAKAAADWAAVPPAEDDGAGKMFLFTEEDGGRHAAVDQEDAPALLAAFKKGNLAMVMIAVDKEFTTVIYFNSGLASVAVAALGEGAGVKAGR